CVAWIQPADPRDWPEFVREVTPALRGLDTYRSAIPDAGSESPGLHRPHCRFIQAETGSAPDSDALRNASCVRRSAIAIARMGRSGCHITTRSGARAPDRNEPRGVPEYIPRATRRPRAQRRQPRWKPDPAARFRTTDSGPASRAAAR